MFTCVWFYVFNVCVITPADAVAVVDAIPVSAALAPVATTTTIVNISLGSCVVLCCFGNVCSITYRIIMMSQRII